MIRSKYLYLLLITVFLASCTVPDTRHQIVISTRDQKLAVLDRGTLMATYPVSTSKFGLGDYRPRRVSVGTRSFQHDPTAGEDLLVRVIERDDIRLLRRS